jgi:sulfur relay (sulfurtransferase) DsrF/TusC family protein
MKKIVVIISKPPFNTIRSSEALRCAVGLTLEDENRVSVLFLGDGALTASSLTTKRAEELGWRKHIETLEMMEAELVAEKEASERYGLELSEPIKIEPKEKIYQAIMEADSIIPF